MMADAVPLAASAKMAAFPLEGAIVPAGCMVQSMTNDTQNDMIFIPTLYGGSASTSEEARSIRGAEAWGSEGCSCGIRMMKA